MSGTTETEYKIKTVFNVNCYRIVELKDTTYEPIRIGIIVILYHCSSINIDIKALPSNTTAIVIDNTPDQDLHLESQHNIQYISLRKNVGIAEAQNIGLKAASELGCTYIVFLDQDSILPENYIELIVKEYERISFIQPKLFLLGPLVYNGRDGREYKSKIHDDTPTDYDFIPRREIISSGSCIAMDRIRDIGFLDSKMFIDYVDFEWCWRANSKGYQSGITPKVSISHFVGQQEYFFLNQLVIISSPIRYYYQTRNYIWLLRYNYVPLSWKINTGLKRFMFSLTYPFKVREWKSIYRNIWNGIIDGIKSKNKK